MSEKSSLTSPPSSTRPSRLALSSSSIKSLLLLATSFMHYSLIIIREVLILLVLTVN